MPMFKYSHDCGFEQRFYSNKDVETQIIPCYRCGRRVTARQVRDKSEFIGEADGVKGVLKREPNTKN